MKRLVFATLLALAPVVARAEFRLVPTLPPGAQAIAPGTLRNPYVVYDRGVPTAQMNTPQMGTAPSYQPLLTTPLGRALGADWGDPFGGRGVLGR